MVAVMTTGLPPRTGSTTHAADTMNSRVTLDMESPFTPHNDSARPDRTGDPQVFARCQIPARQIAPVFMARPRAIQATSGMSFPSDYRPRRCRGRLFFAATYPSVVLFQWIQRPRHGRPADRRCARFARTGRDNGRIARARAGRGPVRD